jgi:hypothetical protein
MKLLKDIVNEDIDEQSIVAAHEYLPSVRPIYTVNDRFGPELKASCILFEVDTTKFLITAGHVFDNLEGSAIYIGGAKRLVHIKGQYFRTRPKGNSENDKYDLAYVEIDVEALGEIGNVRFLHSDELDPNDFATEAHLYLILGYPATKNERIDYENHKTLLKPYIYSANSPELIVYKRLDVLEESHILINFDRKRITNKSHEILTAPKPHGLSGGGIWRIRDYSDVASLSGPSPKKLVGIVIEGHPMQKVIMGVRISCIIEAIKHQYPHLREKLPNVNRIHATINSKAL